MEESVDGQSFSREPRRLHPTRDDIRTENWRKRQQSVVGREERGREKGGGLNALTHEV